MKYSEIQNHMDTLNAHLQLRDDAIRKCADSVISKLIGNDFGFPENEICLQPLDSPSNDSKGYFSIELPTENTRGDRGFRIRFTKNYPGYLCGLVVLVRWSFVATDHKLTATIHGSLQGGASVVTDLHRPTAATFIDEIAKVTATEVGHVIISMCSDSGVGQEMGFHKIKEG